MIHAVLMLALVQAAELSLEVSTRKGAEGFDVRIAGRGSALRGHEMIGLRFHRRVNRADWSDGSIRTEALEEPWGRCAHVRDGAFVHLERFRAPAEVELRLILGGEGPDFVRTIRVGTGADVARRLKRDIRDVEAALASLRKIGSETAFLFGAKRPSKPRARILIGRLERLRLALVEQEESALATASIDAALNLLSDLQQACESVRAGKSCGDMRLSLSGEIISAESIERCLVRLLEVLKREQAIVLLQSVSALCHEIESVMLSGREGARRRRGIERSLEALAAGAEEGALSERTTSAGATLADLVAGAEEYFNLAVSAAVCPGLAGTDLDHWQCWLYDQAGDLEEKLRKGP